MDEEQENKWEAAKNLLYENRYYRLKDNLKAKLNLLIMNCGKKMERAKTRFESFANAYIHHPVYGQDKETRKLTAEIQFLDEYRSLLEQLSANTLTNIADHRSGETLELNLHHMKSRILSLSSQIRRSVKDYKERVDELNETMKSISYDNGKHIYLEYKDTQDAKYTAFKRDVDEYNNYLNNIEMTDIVDDPKKKQEFDEKLLEFLKKYDARGDTSMKNKLADLADTRNQLKFTVCIYNDRTGKNEVFKDTVRESGGEKEYMAYIMIAAALNFSFNLSSVNAKEQSFRVLFIDEAFSRCSINYVRQCMDLFNKFHLQVILLTPSDKSSNYLDYMKGAAAVALNKETHKSQLKMEYYKEDANDSALA